MYKLYEALGVPKRVFFFFLSMQVSEERERELDTYLQDKKKEGEPTVDDLIEPKDALSQQ